MSQTYDVIILGTGIAALGAARGLLSRGKSVLLAGRQGIEGAASDRAAGMLNPFLGIEPGNPLLPLTLDALCGFPRWVRELERISGLPAGYRRTGLLYLARSAEEVKDLKKRFKWQERQPVRVKWFEQSALRKKFPYLAPEIQAGLFLPDVGRVKAALFMKAFRTYIQKSGGRFVYTSGNCKVQKSSEGGYFVSAGTKTWRAGQVVNACGAWAGEPEGPAALSGVKPARGQIFIVKAPLESGPILHTPEDGYMVPWEKNLFLCGSTLEMAGYRAQTTAQGRREVWRELTSLVPCFEDAKEVDSWAGLRPLATGRLPVIGPLSRGEGLFVATGFFRSGILLGAYLGDLLAEGMTQRFFPKQIKRFFPKPPKS